MARMKTLKVKPTIESPSWGQLQKMATTIIDVMGGPKGAAEKLSWENLYCLSILASLNLDEVKAAAPIFGRRFLS